MTIIDCVIDYIELVVVMATAMLLAGVVILACRQLDHAQRRATLGCWVAVRRAR